MGGISHVPINLAALVPTPWQEVLDLSPLDNISKQLGSKFIPNQSLIFKALETPPDAVKVVIIGQDPYPNSDHAMGLAFSVDKRIKILPDSLQNIFKELKSDLNITRSTGDLTDWVKQGVLLLNMSLTLTTKGNAPHSKIGWQIFTESVVKKISSQGVIAILWGKQAQEMKKYFQIEDLILGPHPSPLSAYRGFFGSKPFSKVNDRLIQKGSLPIKW